MRLIVRLLSALVFTASPLPFAAAAAETPAATVSGTVTSFDGRAVANARVVLDGPSHLVVVSGADGRFALSPVSPGTYSARVTAARFSQPAVATIDVASGQTTTLAFVLARSESSLVSIGRVVANGRDTVSTSATPATTINAQAYADLGYTRVSDVLQDDETTTLVHPAGGGSGGVLGGDGSDDGGGEKSGERGLDDEGHLHCFSLGAWFFVLPE